jgi:hypothetical protein
MRPADTGSRNWFVISPIDLIEDVSGGFSHAKLRTITRGRRQASNGFLSRSFPDATLQHLSKRSKTMSACDSALFITDEGNGW